MTDLTALRELLARAVELEEKSAAEVEVDHAAELEEIAAIQAEADLPPGAEYAAVPAPADDFGWGDGVVFDFDDPKGWELEAKGWNPCPSCGSTNVDEYADGTARCEDCGTPLTGSGSVEALGERNTPLPERIEGKDFDFEDEGLDELVGFDEKALAGEEPDLDEWADFDLEPVAEAKADVETLSEIELLIARRNELTA